MHLTKVPFGPVGSSLLEIDRQNCCSQSGQVVLLNPHLDYVVKHEIGGLAADRGTLF